MLIVEDKVLQSQVDRILQSDELRSSEVLRRLLKFLAEKSASGEADHLKEYAVAIDGLGKPPSYDPRHNSAVRIQVGRLRQKLAEYYRAEGREDTVLIDLPKGRFKLTCEQRFPAEVHPPSFGHQPAFLPGPPPAAPAVTREVPIRPLSILMWLGLSVAIGLSAYSGIHAWRTAGKAALILPGWTSDLQELWGPFVDSGRPLILAIEDPLFVELKSDPGIYYRDKSLNHWKDVVTSPSVASLRKAVKDADIQPSRYYTAYGEVDVSFLLGKLLGPRVQNFSVVKTSQISWQQLADNNVLFVGVQNLFFDEQLHGMPLEPQFLPFMDGIRNVHPENGEPASFTDKYSTAPAEEGVAYALVTRIPGPLRNNDVVSFTSSRSAGYVGAVQSFSDPNFAKVLVARLKKTAGGEAPRYYQVILKVKFRDDVPTETTYVLSRELH
jgi:hypothetical protein